MTNEPSPQSWKTLSEEALTGMADWRSQHPHVSLSEIEREVDARLGALRARMIQDAAQASAAANWKEHAEAAVPTCPDCGTRMRSAGLHQRRLQTSQGQRIEIKRAYAICPICGYSFFPPR